MPHAGGEFHATSSSAGSHHTVAAGSRVKLSSRSAQESRFAWLMISPSLLLMVLLGTFPLVALVGLSFFRLDLGSLQRTGWVGLGNYTRLLADSRFWHSLEVAAIYAVSSVTFQIVIGMALALLLFRTFPGQGVVRTLVLLPMILAPVVVGILWRTLLLTPRFGLFDYLVSSLGLGSHGWLEEPTLALVSIIVIHTWQWTPFAFLVFLASLNALPVEPLEQAHLDCRARWQELWYVILPLMRPAIVIVLILRSIQALNAFAAVYAATGGGPGTATEILNLYTYQTAFVQLSIGYGSALGTVQLLLTLAIAMAFFRIRRSEWAQ
jgi:multiple sugar transport system permease protein